MSNAFLDKIRNFLLQELNLLCNNYPAFRIILLPYLWHKSHMYTIFSISTCGSLRKHAFDTSSLLSSVAQYQKMFLHIIQIYKILIFQKNRSFRQLKRERFRQIHFDKTTLHIWKNTSPSFNRDIGTPSIHVKGAGQVLSRVVTLQPQPVMEMMVLMLIIIIPLNC